MTTEAQVLKYARKAGVHGANNARTAISDLRSMAQFVDGSTQRWRRMPPGKLEWAGEVQPSLAKWKREYNEYADRYPELKKHTAVPQVLNAWTSTSNYLKQVDALVAALHATINALGA